MKPIPGCPGYFADKSGRIFSRRVDKGKTFREKKQSCDTKHTGYMFVCIQVAGKQKKVWVHRAVLIAYKGQPGPGQEARHRNGIRTDCRLSNLRWGTGKQNAADKKLHGTDGKGKPNPKIQGQKHHGAILSDAEAKGILGLAYNANAKALASAHGVSVYTIYAIWGRRIWKHLATPAAAQNA